MFIETLFTVARIWKQRKCLSADEWIKKKKMWEMYTMEYYSARKKWNSAICNNVDGPSITLSEISHTEKDKYSVNTFHVESKK